MRKRDLLLNLLLALSLAGLSWKLLHDWRNYATENSPQKLEIHPMSGVSVPPSAPLPDYTVVARQNPFSADRNDVIEQPAAQAKPIGPPPLIYGSIVLGEQRFALMGTEQSPKPERVLEGQTFEGYRLVKILPESVILESPAGRDEIMLYNALMRLRRQAARTATASTTHPVATIPVGSAPVNTTPQQPAVANTMSANSAATSNSQASSDQNVTPGKEVVQTPFGPLLVDKRKP